MAPLRDLELVVAAVALGDAFCRAAETLVAARCAAIAVLDADQRVAGLFTDDDVLRGLFPGYLEELRHTAFLEEGVIAANFGRVANDPVELHMSRAETIERDASAAHVVERFLHTPSGALAVVDRGVFAGMAVQSQVSRLLLAQLPRGA